MTIDKPGGHQILRTRKPYKERWKIKAKCKIAINKNLTRKFRNMFYFDDQYLIIEKPYV